MRDDDLRLKDIHEAIERIQRYSERGRAAFDADELIQVWIIHFLQIVGEAARALAPETRTQAPDVPWTKIIGMRNIVVHQYFGIDTETVWRVVELDLPVLMKHIESLMRTRGIEDTE